MHATLYFDSIYHLLSPLTSIRSTPPLSVPLTSYKASRAQAGIPWLQACSPLGKVTANRDAGHTRGEQWFSQAYTAAHSEPAGWCLLLARLRELLSRTTQSLTTPGRSKAYSTAKDPQSLRSSPSLRECEQEEVPGKARPQSGFCNQDSRFI